MCGEAPVHCLPSTSSAEMSISCIITLYFHHYWTAYLGGVLVLVQAGFARTLKMVLLACQEHPKNNCKKILNLLLSNNFLIPAKIPSIYIRIIPFNLDTAVRRGANLYHISRATNYLPQCLVCCSFPHGDPLWLCLRMYMASYTISLYMALCHTRHIKERRGGLPCDNTQMQYWVEVWGKVWRKRSEEIPSSKKLGSLSISWDVAWVDIYVEMERVVSSQLVLTADPLFLKIQKSPESKVIICFNYTGSLWQVKVEFFFRKYTFCFFIGNWTKWMGQLIVRGLMVVTGMMVRGLTGWQVR